MHVLYRGVGSVESVYSVDTTEMRYLKPTDGLPDPKGSLSSPIHQQLVYSNR